MKNYSFTSPGLTRGPVNKESQLSWIPAFAGKENTMYKK